MSLRTRMLPVFDRLRGLTGPSRFDIRPTSLGVVTRRWTSGAVGVEPDDGTQPAYADTRLDLPAVYKVRQVSTREIASSGGRYETGDVKVGPITPSYTNADGSLGGVSEAQLKPAVADAATEILYELVGAHAGDYSLLGLITTSPFGWWVVLGRRQTTP
ncbi:MAG TPA: hypothetical protein VGG39_37735 [Polyangiaceae bacterium]|jgi:hypothetical protein